MKPETQTATINPVFAGYAAQQLQEAVGGIQRVFDNLLEIARGNDPEANGYDRLRATRVLYDRGFGKITRTQPRTPSPVEEVVKTARGMRVMQIFGDRLYFDENGSLRLHPPDHIDDS